MRSFVFPGNFVGNLPAVAAAGFATYRAADGYDLDWPILDKYGLWCLPKGLCIERPLPNWSHADWAFRLRRTLDRAIATGTLCHFWFHPSLDHTELELILTPLLEHLAAHRDELWVTTMGVLADWLNRDGDREGEQ